MKKISRENENSWFLLYMPNIEYLDWKRFPDDNLITMPHMSGFEFAQRIREIRADVPIILNSGFQDTDDMQKIESIGINLFLQKPFDLKLLADAVHNVLKK